MVSGLADYIAGEAYGLFAIGGGSNRTDTDIYSNMVGGFPQIGFGYFKGLEEEPFLAIAFEVCLTSGVLKEMFALLSYENTLSNNDKMARGSPHAILP